MTNLEKIRRLNDLAKKVQDKDEAKKAALIGMEKGRRMAVEIAKLDKKRSG